jgi:HAD superfamily hydrolase (TIGR01549 family)
MRARRKRAAGFIFDIDGTLVDSNDAHAHAWQDAFHEFGKDVPYPTVRSHIGKGGDLLVPDLLNAREMRRFGKKIMKFRKLHFKRQYLPKIQAFPGIRAQFERIRARNAKIVLASSSDPDEVRHYIRLLEVQDLIGGATSKKDAEYSKPSPEIFEAALARITTPALRTMVVGDTPYDILAAHRLALPIVAVRCGGFDDRLLQKSEFVLDDTEEMSRRLDEIDDYFSAD